MAENTDDRRVDQRFGQRQGIGDPRKEGNQSQVEFTSGNQLDNMEDDNMNDDDLEDDDDMVLKLDEEDDDIDDAENEDNHHKNQQGNHGFGI